MSSLPTLITKTDETAWRIVGPLVPAPVSIFYRIGLAAVAVAMVLLPVFYVGTIGAVAYAVYRHAFNPWYTLGSGWIELLGYITPIIVGVVLVFFMIKPLFARRSRRMQQQLLLPEDEPELFRFVNSICDLVRAPRPRRVQIDLQVNASAGFQRGLRDLFGQNLTLTIGLPLVAGLNIREFGGVLAHEFGHFAQGAATRLTFIVGSVNSWFARVVYDRDVWDTRLRSATGRSDVRLRIIMAIALGAVWLSRGFLWLLMNIGSAISCFMARQMEFDADKWGTQVAGSATYVATSRRLQLLSIAWNRAVAYQQETSLANRLVDDLPGLVAISANRMPEQVLQTVEQSIQEAKTGWFDTHPTVRDRINASNALGFPGVLAGEGGASLLFRDFAATSGQKTMAYYEQEHGFELGDMHLHPCKLIMEEAERSSEEDICAETFFGPLLELRTRLLIQIENMPSADEIPAQTQLAQLLTDAKSVVDVVSKADLAERRAFAAITLLNAGFTIKEKEFGLSDATLRSAEAARAGAQQRIQNELAKLGSALTESGRRLAAGLTASQSAGGATTEAEIERLVELLGRFTAVGANLIHARTCSMALEHLLLNPARELNTNRWNTTATELSTLIEKDLAMVLAQFESHDYPFAHAKGKIPLCEFLVGSAPHINSVPATFWRGKRLVERASVVQYRVLAKLAALARRAESATSGAP